MGGENRDALGFTVELTFQLAVRCTHVYQEENGGASYSRMSQAWKAWDM